MESSLWETEGMPTLIPNAFDDKSNVPYAWTCSDCGQVFAQDRITAMPTTTQIKKVNSNFEEHCRHTHTGTVVLLSLPKVPQERAVREATEDK